MGLDGVESVVLCWVRRAERIGTITEDGVGSEETIKVINVLVPKHLKSRPSVSCILETSSRIDEWKRMLAEGCKEKDSRAENVERI
jgi:hypothetical protein